MNLKMLQVFAPEVGLITEQPSILLPNTATSDIQDMYFQSGEVKRYKKRIQMFNGLPDGVITKFTFAQESQDRKYLMYFTKKDVCYRDRVADNFVFLNQAITNVVIDSVASLTGNQTQLTVTLGTGTSISYIKAGDYIRIGDNTSSATTDDIWYEIASVEGVDTLIIDGDLPTGYYVPTGGDVCYIRQTFAGLDSDIWVVDNASETLIATNNGIDYPIMWRGGDDLVENLTEEFKCRWLTYYSGRAFAGYIISGGQNYPVNIRWSGLLDFTDWGDTGSDAGEIALTEGRGYISRLLSFRDYLYVIKSESIERLWAVASEDIVNTKLLRNDLGTKSPHSFVIYRDMIYFYCTLDRTFRKFDGFSDIVISKNQDSLVKGITLSSENIIRGYFIGETRQLIWSIPYGGETTLNKLLIADIDYSNSPWTVIDMVVLSFGKFELYNGYNWDNLPYPDWSSWVWDSWRGADGFSESTFDCCSDYDGNIYQMNASRLDNDEEYTSHIVFETDMSNKKGALPVFKRLLKIQVYTRDKGTGDVRIDIKRDLEAEWQSGGSFDLYGGKDINISIVPMDFRAKTFKIRFSSEYDFELIGFVLYYSPLGDR